MLEELAPSGVIGHIQIGANILIPKPYTGWQREAMERPELLKPKISQLKRGIAKLPNVSLGTMSIKHAAWQTFLSKADSSAADILEQAAAGDSTSSLLRRHATRIEPVVYRHSGSGRRLAWQFMRTG